MSKKTYNFGESISPQSLQIIISDPKLISNLLDWQLEELNNFKKAVKKLGVNDFIKQYKTKIKKKLDNEGLFENWFERMKFYWRMEETKLISLLERSDKEHKVIQNEIKELAKKGELIKLISETWDRKSKKKLAKKQGAKLQEFFIESYKTECKRISIYGLLIYDSFFVAEYNCKYLCAMGCFRFAKNIAKSKTLGHSDIWKTLKNLSGRKKAENCDHCFTRESCNFDKRFWHLHNLYTFLIKLRMLCDYSETFHFTPYRKDTYDIISNRVLPTIIEIHKFKDLIIKKSKIMFSPISDEELGIK